MTIDPSASFEPYRRRLRGLAYRMLGSMAEAEDAVQEAYLRWHDVDRDAVAEPRAFLTTTTTRICLDVLKSARGAVLEGAHRVAAFLAGAVKKGWTADLTARVETINGLPGLLVTDSNGLVQTTAFEFEGNLIKTIYAVRNPDKLRHLA